MNVVPSLETAGWATNVSRLYSSSSECGDTRARSWLVLSCFILFSPLLKDCGAACVGGACNDPLEPVQPDAPGPCTNNDQCNEKTECCTLFGLCQSSEGNPCTLKTNGYYHKSHIAWSSCLRLTNVVFITLFFAKDCTYNNDIVENEYPIDLQACNYYSWIDTCPERQCCTMFGRCSFAPNRCKLGISQLRCTLLFLLAIVFLTWLFMHSLSQCCWCGGDVLPEKVEGLMKEWLEFWGYLSCHISQFWTEQQ